jgi:hypothetical protein
VRYRAKEEEINWVERMRNLSVQYLDLNFLVSIHDFKFLTAKTKNPLIPAKKRKRSYFETETFGSFISARIATEIQI